jgi:pSer/pThr/pTyr-binding forkhead associated (FHA) protein
MTSYRITWGSRHLDVHDQCLIGRNADCDIDLGRDTLVSRRHARLTACAHGIVIEDLGSRNGVLVDGRRLTRSELLIGRHDVSIGETSFALEPLDESLEASRITWDDLTTRWKAASKVYGRAGDGGVDGDLIEPRHPTEPEGAQAWPRFPKDRAPDSSETRLPPVSR